MRDASEPVVRLTIANAEFAAHSAAALSAGGCKIVALEDNAEIDVLIVDDLASEASARATGGNRTSEPAVVLIADAAEQMPLDPPVDAVLPPTVGKRELLQTVRLVAEIAKLRRQFRHSSQARQDLARLAMTDPLTSLPNRRAWDEELTSRANEARTQRRSLGVAILDLDQFKTVNDQLGFAAGDAVLRAAATALGALLRAGDFVARVGGDEFGLLFSGVAAAQATAACERVRTALAQRLTVESPVPVTASIGLCVLAKVDSLARLNEVGAAELFARADAALRTAKHSGRNQTVCNAEDCIPQPSPKR